MLAIPWNSSHSVAAIMSAMVIGACGPRAEEAPARDAHDALVPASEARAELTMNVSLLPRRDCEEAFDLALYKEPAVELISWTGDNASCEDRRVTVRFLPARTSREAILSRVRKLTRKAEVNGP